MRMGDISSTFTANIARPGSGSMFVHSDQSLVAPEPWLQPWSVNIIWCLTDVTFENGATLYIPVMAIYWFLAALMLSGNPSYAAAVRTRRPMPTDA